MTALALRGLLRSPGRSVARVLVLAIAVALLGSMLIFIGHSLRTMTQGAVRSVPLDWQGPVPSHRAAVVVAGRVARQPGIQEATPVATAPFAGASHRAPVGLINASAGAILAVAPRYAAHIQTIRYLHGTLKPGSIVLDQQLAATLQAGIGDTVSLTPRHGAPPVSLPVSGIAVVGAGDVLFQPLNPVSGPAPAQPPANVAILPLATFARRIAPRFASIGPATPASSAVPGAQRGVQWQVQAQVDPRSLRGGPASALKQATRIRNRVERSLPGQVQFVDNLGDGLSTAAGDALYAETLYIMLAVPGALVALALAYLAALGTVERDRRDLGLLRSRGASKRDLLVLTGVESAVIGVLAGGVGTGVALLTVSYLVGSAGGTGLVRALVTFTICVTLAFLG
ncbi:MAG: hypothetical protein ACXVRE_04520, partial [Gaiellaceae bacterium]